MIERFLKFYEACHNKKMSLCLDINHDNFEGWYICIIHEDSDTTIFNSDNCSLNLLCAHAYIALEEWAREFIELEDIEINLK